MPSALFLAFANPTEGDEVEFNRWYEERHIPDVLANVDGMVAATRFEVAAVETVPGLPTLDHRYITVYEVEAETQEDASRIAAALGEAMAAGTVDVSPTLDLGTAIPAFLLPLSDRRTS